MPTKTEFQNFLRARRSIRRFQAQPIPDGIIETILTTATYAPSAHNCQPWRFVVLKKEAQSERTRLGRALTHQMEVDMQAQGAQANDIEKRVKTSLRRLAEAPLVIMLCRDINAVRTHSPQEALMGIQSVALAGLQLLLAAHAEGLGGNWICWPLYAQQPARNALGLPDAWEPQSLYFLGYPAEKPEPKTLIPTSEIVKTFSGTGQS